MVQEIWETAIGIELSVSQIGLDIHREFSRVTARDCDGKVAWRRRVEHGGRPRMRAELVRWPAGTPVVREQREWLRSRMTLVRLQTGLKNRIHAILRRHGILHEQSDLFGHGGRRFLSLLIAPNDATLPSSARATLEGYLQLFDHARRQIASATPVAQAI